MSTKKLIETAVPIESKYYKWISKVIARLLGNILDLFKLNDTKYYLAKSKLFNINILYNKY